MGAALEEERMRTSHTQGIAWEKARVLGMGKSEHDEKRTRKKSHQKICIWYICQNEDINAVQYY